MSDTVRWACTGEEKLRRREKGFLERRRCLEKVLGKRDRSKHPLLEISPRQPDCRCISKFPLLDPLENVLRGIKRGEGKSLGGEGWRDVCPDAAVIIYPRLKYRRFNDANDAERASGVSSGITRALCGGHSRAGRQAARSIVSIDRSIDTIEISLRAGDICRREGRVAWRRVFATRVKV